MVAIQLGMELGLTPMAALQNIAVINGRPGIYGDAALALVRASGLLESYSQKIEGEGDKRTAVVKVVRRGEGGGETEARFSVTDAKTAGLWGKSGPWTQYPERMLLFRARGFALRDGFGDVLKGLRTTEELSDMPAEVNVTPERDALRIAGPSAGITAAAEAGSSSTAKTVASEDTGNRQQVIADLKALLTEHEVSEAKLFGYAQRAKLASSNVDELFDLPTDVLAKLKFAVASQSTKGASK